MRVDELDGKELVEFDPGAGEIRVAGQRAILIDATAMGNLRKELVGQLGAEAARVVLTRFGFIQGWCMAEAMESQFKWESEADRMRAGGRIHMIEGMYRIEPGDPGALSVEGSTLVSSFEAEQHVAHLGRSETSTCWMICGLTSGYLSRALGQEIFVLEDIRMPLFCACGSIIAWHSCITSRNCCTLVTGLSNTIGGQAHWPSSLILR